MLEIGRFRAATCDGLTRRAFLRTALAAGLGVAALRPAVAAACVANAQRIVSIGGAVTEIVAALDGFCRVIATDTTSLYPRGVFELPRVGYMRTLAAEGIVALNPSLVLASDRSGPEAVLRQIKDSGVDIRIIQVLLGHNSLSTTARYTQVATTTIAAAQSPLDRLTLEVVPPA